MRTGSANGFARRQRRSFVRKPAKRTRIPPVEAALSACDSHLAANSPVDAEVRMLLIQALLIRMYAEFERVIRSHVRRRCAGVRDESVIRFLDNCADSVIRNLKIEGLASLLGRFSRDSKRVFQSRMDHETTRVYGSLISDRNRIAHGEGLPPTLEEVREYYLHAQIVLEHFRYALFRGVDDAADTRDDDR